MIKRNVYLEGEHIPDEEEFVEVKRGDLNRFWHVEITNMKRGRRVTRGTAGLWRMRKIFEAIKKIHPGCVKSKISEKNPAKPLTVRLRVAGPVILKVWPMEGPSIDAATKH